jgi:hypothetical protein
VHDRRLHRTAGEPSSVAKRRLSPRRRRGHGVQRPHETACRCDPDGPCRLWGDDSTPSAATYPNVEAIAEALQAAGTTCEGFHVDQPGDENDIDVEGVPKPVESGDCTDAEYDVELTLYESEADAKRATGKTAFVAYCLVAEGFGFDIDGAEIATGGNWTVSATDPDGAVREAGEYAKALGGSVKKIDCP